MTLVSAPAAARARDCFLRACWLDVAVRKPGNVSLESPGHGMHGDLFLASAQTAAAPLFTPGARVGTRIEAAVAATWEAVGCNTNLGILLLCAPVAAAVERAVSGASPVALRAALDAVLADLSLEDARAAYRAIALANPGGLGSAPEQDVRAEPTTDLRSAMALAAGRDSIARQYVNGFADVFEVALAGLASGLELTEAEAGGPVDAATARGVQRVFLEFASRLPDSHIVRKHGEAAAHTVMAAAQGWRRHPAPGSDPGFVAWDDRLKRQGFNPGTTADLTVAALLVAGILGPSASSWHGS
jgi:triphosphoribosyl-dephospho-CoA synthase